MSTANPSVLFDNRSVGNFRTWAQALHDSLVSIGLVQTADTGQITISTMAIPAASAYAGYEIFRLNDALQATKPVFIKVEYGTGAASAIGAFRFSVSNGTNGAGILNGTVISTAQVLEGQGAVADTAPQPAYFCGDTSSVVFAWPCSQVSGGWRPGVVMIERTRNSDGSANGDGLVFATQQGHSHGSAGTSYGDSTAQVLSFLTTTVGPAYRWWPLAAPSIWGFWDQAGSVGTDINLFPFSVACPKPEAQALSVLGCYAYAVAPQAQAPVVVNGAPHTYLSLGSQIYVTTYVLPFSATWTANSGSAGYGANANAAQILMRYE